MSFDWLNIPGLSAGDSAPGFSSDASQPPPNVSFDFGATMSSKEDDRATIRRDTSTSMATQKHVINGMNGWNGSRPVHNPNEGQRQMGQAHHYQQYSHKHSQQYSQEGQHAHQEHQHHYTNQLSTRRVQPIQASQDDYKESPDDLKVPLSLSHSQLTKEEVKNYLRWYNYITARTRVKLVRLGDVFKFLSNFNLPEKLKSRITSIFRTCKNALNIGQFFAVLRLISKSLLEQVMPVRKMILEKAPIPKPQPILCTGAKQETYEEVDEEVENNGGQGDDKVDFDSFASMLLTGNKPASKKRLRRKVVNSAHSNKKVRFAEKVTFQDPPSDIVDSQGHGTGTIDEEDAEILDFSLPMDQLLKRMAKKKEKNSALVSHLPNEQQETEEEKEVLEDMKDSLSHFKQIQTPDMAGVPEQIVAGMIPNGVNDGDSNGQQPQQLPLQPLKPTSTGSANYLFRSQFPPTVPGAAGVASGAEVPAQQVQVELQPLKPTATGSANHLVRSHFSSDQLVAMNSPIQHQQQHQQQQHQQQTHTQQQLPNTQADIGGLQPLKPTATGSANYLMKQQFDPQPMSGGQSMNTGHMPMNNGQPSLSAGPVISPVASPEGVASPTNHYLTVNKVPQHQQTLSYQESALQQQNSPQPASQNPNMLSAPNPASNYFHSLLSHSPSPSQSNLSMPGSNSNLNLPNIQQSPSPYLSSPNLPAQSIANNHQPVIYNNGYHYHSPIPQQQQQLPQRQPQYYSAPQQQMQYPQGYAHSVSPMAAQGTFGMQATAQPQNTNILGDLHSLRQQVDALQNVYGRR
ncbi:uncharacterized protein ZBAI_04910 [Zygosaccharomyces bailii ISA1307]|nr:uncharacterized protein ZBAI_04910 [Zygosaccharomyces bailii ISA1307]